MSRVASEEEKLTVRHAVMTLRVVLGMTQAELAKASGLSVACICTIETGTRSPSVSTLGKIAKGLGVPVAIFMIVMSNDLVSEDKTVMAVVKLLRDHHQHMLELKALLK